MHTMLQGIDADVAYAVNRRLIILATGLLYCKNTPHVASILYILIPYKCIKQKSISTLQTYGIIAMYAMHPSFVEYSRMQHIVDCSSHAHVVQVGEIF